MVDTKDSKLEFLRPEDVLQNPEDLARFQESIDLAEAAHLVRAMRGRALRVDGRKGISQAELANRIEVSQSRISQIESGEGRDGPSFTLLKRIARACGIDWPGELSTHSQDETETPIVPEDRVSDKRRSTENRSRDLELALLLLERIWGPQGDFSLPQFERALAIQEGALGPDHPDIATTFNRFAETLLNRGDFDMALALSQRALAIREKTLGPDHPDTAMSLNTLALVFCKRGEQDAARPLFERALPIFEKAFGPDHRETVLLRDMLAFTSRPASE
jgi:transcriptional regulator with XRE-family HTH domain